MPNPTLDFAKGYQTFKEVYFKQHEKDFIRLVKEGQNPQTVFIGCSDSRIIPDLILGTKPGELFVIRTAGNFVPPYHSQATDGVTASIQFALESLNVRHIIICGHSHCGAIEALFKHDEKSESNVVTNWLQHGQQAKLTTLSTIKEEKTSDKIDQMGGQVSVIYQLQHLLTYPLVKKGVEEGNLEIHGWYYKIEEGDLTYYDPELYKFVSITQAIKNHQS